MENMHRGILFIVIMTLAFVSYPSVGITRVDIDVNITPPPLVISEPPAVIVIPGTYIYFYPEAGEDFFFCGGFWYRPYRTHWYRSGSYAGPWVRIAPARVPYGLRHLPRDFRAMSGYRRIPYAELHRNWKTWERDRYWEKHGWNREEERERHHGIAPPYRGERDFDRGDHDSGRGRDRERD